MWLQHPNVLNVVTHNWLHNNDYLDVAIKYIDHASNWNIHTFKNIFYKKKILLNRLGGHQHMDPNKKNSFHYNLENRRITDFNTILKLEEEF